MLGDMGNKRAVRILLECNLVESLSLDSIITILTAMKNLFTSRSSLCGGCTLE